MGGDDSLARFSPEAAVKDYDYFGAGMSADGETEKMILRTKGLTSDGKKIVVALSGKGEIQAVK